MCAFVSLRRCFLAFLDDPVAPSPTIDSKGHGLFSIVRLHFILFTLI